MIEDPELALSLVYAPIECRAALAVLWQLDERLARTALGQNPPLAAIKLAWWREALEKLDSAKAPAEPLLREVADHLLPAGINGTRLSAIANGWDMLLEEGEDGLMMLARHADTRGGTLFACAADLLGGARAIDVQAEGAIWALTTLPVPFAELARKPGIERVRNHKSPVWPRRLRAIGLLAVLARDRLAREGAATGSPRRIARALWHAASGR